MKNSRSIDAIFGVNGIVFVLTPNVLLLVVTFVTILNHHFALLFIS